MTIPVRVFLSQSQSARPTDDRGREDEEAGQRVLDAGDLDVDPPVEDAWPGDVLSEGPEVGDHLVGEDDRDRDRDQRLPELLTLVPAQEYLLDAEAEEPDQDRGDERRDEPLPEVHLLAQEPERGVLADEPALELQGDVPAEQEERAMRHVHDAHQPEDEREATRDDEVDAGRGDAVQERDDEVVRVVDRRAERGLHPGAPELRAGLGREEDPDERERRETQRHDSRHRSQDAPRADSLSDRQGERTKPSTSLQRRTSTRSWAQPPRDVDS